MLDAGLSWLCQEPDGTMRTDGPKPRVLLSGSFNPLHEGHRKLAHVAQRRLGSPVAFELSIVNVDKPEIAAEEVRRRAKQFLGLAPVYITRAKGFEGKATLFAGAVMVVGADTAERIVAVRYYNNDSLQRDRTLINIRNLGCRFLVAGRLGQAGKFLDLRDVDIPENFRDLFDGISEEEFRLDQSSSLLRQSSM